MAWMDLIPYVSLPAAGLESEEFGIAESEDETTKCKVEGELRR